MSFTLQAGALFADRYRIVRCIATGGMGAVYEAVHIETERRRALKVMLPHLFKSPELRERFKREARVAAQIDSEYIVDVFDAGVDAATEMPFLVMELLRGEELGARLERIGRLPPNEVVLCLHQAALALDKTHQAHIVHRDLKPENLFLVFRERGSAQIKVLDFGVAKFIAENATAAGATLSVGTPFYMSPEQFQSGMITHAVDLYALGMMAYTLLIGEPYWAEEGRSSASLFAFSSVTTQGPKELPSVRAARRGVSLPAAFDAWFQTATATNPLNRFQTATATVEALAEALGLTSLLAGAAPFWPAEAAERASQPAVQRLSTPLGAGATTPMITGADDPAAAGLTRPEGNRSGATNGAGSRALESAMPSLAASSRTPDGVQRGSDPSDEKKAKRPIILAALLGGCVIVGGAFAVAAYAFRSPTPVRDAATGAPVLTSTPVVHASVQSAQSANDAPPTGRATVVVEPAASGNLAAPPPQLPAVASSTLGVSTPGKGVHKAVAGTASPPAPPATTRSTAEPIYTRD